MWSACLLLKKREKKHFAKKNEAIKIAKKNEAIKIKLKEIINRV